MSANPLPPVAPSMPGHEYQPPAGILVGPDLVQGVQKGERVAEFMPEELAEIEEIGRGLTESCLVPVGIVRSSDPNNHHTFQQFFQAWIGPEVMRRVAAGGRSDSLLPVRQALIVFPPRSDPDRHRVLLNEEVQVRAAVRPSYPGALLGVTPGQVVNLGLRDMFDLRGFVLQGVDMERDGFAWLRPEPPGFALYFNFLPSSGFAGHIPESDRQQVMRSRTPLPRRCSASSQPASSPTTQLSAMRCRRMAGAPPRSSCRSLGSRCVPPTPPLTRLRRNGSRSQPSVLRISTSC